MNNEFKPTKEEIRVMSHYWAVAYSKVKRARNRKERRELMKDAKRKVQNSKS